MGRSPQGIRHQQPVQHLLSHTFHVSLINFGVLLKSHSSKPRDDFPSRGDLGTVTCYNPENTQRCLYFSTK